ncbi:MAG: P-loop NTPase [Thermoanaerobaculales bacterium]|jgi:anion-transporting  ArsA/GET3 family ATPase|nr:P-loop NTPase [Thermoanaerobaculales bacterium]
MDVIRRLEELQLIVVTGKGGVGKSVVTAALGRLLATRGRKVLLLEVDPRENLHQLLNTPPSGGDIVKASPGLFLQHIEPRELIDDLVRERLKVKLLVNRVLASPVHRHFTEGAPGLKETAVFGRALRLVEGHGPPALRRPDAVILDAPATGHGVSWMAAPQLVADVVRSGPIGHMAGLISAFLGDRRRVGVVVVTTAEEMPVEESRELIGALRERLDRQPEAVIANALYPPFDDDVASDDETTALWRDRRAINVAQLERLDEVWAGPRAEVPLLPIDPGPALVGAVSRTLADQLRSA